MEGGRRNDLVRLGALIALLVLATGAVLLAGSGAGSPGSGAPGGAGSKFVDGVLTTVSDTELVIQPTDGSGAIRFPLRPIDARRLDLFHLELHARDQLPSRLFYAQKGERRTVLRVDDL